MGKRTFRLRTEEKAPSSAPLACRLFLWNSINPKDVTLSPIRPLWVRLDFSPVLSHRQALLTLPLAHCSKHHFHGLCVSQDHPREVQLRRPEAPRRDWLLGAPGSLHSCSLRSGPHGPALSTSHLVLTPFPVCLLYLSNVSIRLEGGAAS